MTIPNYNRISSITCTTSGQQVMHLRSQSHRTQLVQLYLVQDFSQGYLATCTHIWCIAYLGLDFLCNLPNGVSQPRIMGYLNPYLVQRLPWASRGRMPRLGQPPSPKLSSPLPLPFLPWISTSPYPYRSGAWETSAVVGTTTSTCLHSSSIHLGAQCQDVYFI